MTRTVPEQLPTMNRRHFIATSAALGGLGLTAAARAQQAPPVGTATLTPLPGAREHGFRVWDVSPLDYVAEEYLMTGDALIREPTSVLDSTGKSADGYHAPYNYLQHIPDHTPRQVLGSAPYATRVVIYRPRDMAKFNGTTVIETIHPSDDGFLEVFNVTSRMFASRGFAVATINHPTNFDATRAADPSRYARLAMKDWTQFWGTIQQLALLLKTPGLTPLKARTQRLYLTGYSFTGMCTSTFANFYHNETVGRDGRTLFDGYLPYCNEYYIQPLNVPVIRVNTQSDYNYATNNSYNPFARVPDADDPYNRTRRYEVTGTDHAPLPLAGPGDAVPAPRKADQGQRCAATYPAGAATNPMFFLRPIMEIAFAHMEEWVTRGTPPPHAPWIVISPDIKKARTDQDGNALGGLRMPDIELPLATYGVGQDECRLGGYMLPFSVEKCRQLYGSKARYLAAYDAATDKMVRDRWILPASAARLKAETRAHMTDF